LEGCLYPAVSCDKIRSTHDVRDRSELCRVEEDVQGGHRESHSVDPTNRKGVSHGHERDRGDRYRAKDVHDDHQSFPIQAICPRPDHKAEEQIGDEFHRRRDAETER
jgi:hypothetical protein